MPIVADAALFPVVLARFQWNTTYLVLAIIATVAMAAASFKTVFGDWRGFLGCLFYWFQPDWISGIHGEYWEDRSAEMRLGFWIVAALAAGIMVYYPPYRFVG